MINNFKNEILIQILNHQAGTSPLLISMEDLHWLDSASWSVLIAAQNRLSQVLLVLNTRPLDPPPLEFNRLIENEKTKLVKLKPLKLEDVDILVAARLGVKSIPAPIAQLIRQRSDGHPFFAEELAYALRDSGVLIMKPKKNCY